LCAAWLVENSAMIQDGLQAIEATLRDRQAALEL
jgi:hypothetical protein